jgi:hypothetical protein
MSRNLISDTVESLARGALSEARFLAAAEQLASFSWFESVRQTSGAEDRIGWDFIVYTRDVGRIIFQVKSSRAGALEFLERGSHMRLVAPIWVVVVRPRDEPEVVFGKVLGACILAREEAMATGLRADDRRLCRIARAA